MIGKIALIDYSFHWPGHRGEIEVFCSIAHPPHSIRHRGQCPATRRVRIRRGALLTAASFADLNGKCRSEGHRWLPTTLDHHDGLVPPLRPAPIEVLSNRRRTANA